MTTKKKATKKTKKKVKKRRRPKVELFKPETIAAGDLKPHPRNYRTHPEDQLEHVIASVRENGLYRNIVAAKDLTILAGHGVVEAAIAMDGDRVELSVIRLDIEPDSPQALKILTGDNELGRFAITDKRILTELLQDASEASPDGLLGTGYSDQMLAALVALHASPGSFPVVDSGLDVQHKCPRCGYRWSGKNAPGIESKG